MGLGEDLLGHVGEVGVAVTDMQARVTAKIAALDEIIKALQSNPSAEQTTQAIEVLKAEKARLVAFAAAPNPGETPPGGEPPVTEVPPGGEPPTPEMRRR